VRPCACRHFTNAARPALALPLADAAAVVDVVVWVMVLVELLPHAAISRLVLSAVRPSITRRARPGLDLRMVI
jgi:hypothetical protein